MSVTWGCQVFRSLCLYVCLSTCICPKPCVQASQNFLYMLFRSPLMSVQYIALPDSWKTSHCHIIGHIQIKITRNLNFHSIHQGEHCCLTGIIYDGSNLHTGSNVCHPRLPCSQQSCEELQTCGERCNCDCHKCDRPVISAFCTLLYSQNHLQLLRDMMLSLIHI